ncbi:hypothetical protein [Streptomyces virginiae]|uniref:hypothetical protein n=1 Tax=Streptomyces virginiae TaxID=1961 RepID=UPI0034416BEA
MESPKAVGVKVLREELLAAFDSDSEASIEVRSALIAGADFAVWPGLVPSVRLLHICGRRMRRLQKLGKPSLGFPESLANLSEIGERDLLVGYVDDRNRGGYYFQLHLDPCPLKVIGCIGLKPPSGATPPP